MAHTPAPWIACSVGDYGDYDGRCRVILGDDLRIAVTLGDHDEGEANARLIAASPDLLEAVAPLDDAARDRSADAPEWQDTDTVSIVVTIGDLRKARAAIAKARGQS
jgi:hypothetical protein